MSDNIFQFDIFLSFRSTERDKMEKVKERLDVEKFTVSNYHKNFAPGTFSLENCIRAVRTSRHTVALLTKAWVESEFCVAEALEARQLDPAGRRARLICCKFEDCKLPEFMEFLTFADFTQSWDTGIEQLLLALGRGNPVRTPASSDQRAKSVESAAAAVEEITAVVKKSDDARERVEFYKGVFGDASTQLRTLAFYKQMHGALHDIETKILRMLASGAKRFPGEVNPEDIQQHIDDLADVINRIEKNNLDRPEHLTDPIWIDHLKLAKAKLDAAVISQSREEFGAGVAQVRQVISKQPPKIDADLHYVARNLRLSPLVDALEKLKQDFHSKPQRQETIDNGAGALRKLDTQMRDLVETHHQWQEIEDELRRIAKMTTENDLEELLMQWSFLTPDIEIACANSTQPGAGKLRDLASDVSKAITARDNAQIISRFRFVRTQASRLFFNVDQQLLDFRDQILKVSEPLTRLLDELDDPDP